MTLEQCEAVIKQQQIIIDQLQALTGQHETELRNAETHIASMTNQIADMQRNYSHLASTASTDKSFSDRDKRIDSTNLLRTKDCQPFANKTSYATWAEGCKTDLCVICPELRKFLEHAESSDFDPLKLDDFLPFATLMTILLGHLISSYGGCYII